MVPQNARCRGGVSGDRYLVVSCAPRGIWWGHCEIQEAGLDGPVAGLILCSYEVSNPENIYLD